MRFDTVIKSGNIVTPAGSFTGDIGIAGEKIAALRMTAVVPGLRRSSPPSSAPPRDTLWQF